MELLKELMFLGGSVFIFSVVWFHFEEKGKSEDFKKELETWWDKKNPNEEKLGNKVKLFLEKCPFPRSEREKKELNEELREVQIFLKKEHKIPFDLYEELSAKIAEKRKEISF